MKSSKLLYVFLLVPFILLSCGGNKKTEATYDSLALSYSVLSVLPHDETAFTQGLVVYNHKILESTGQTGTSWIAEVNPATGKHDKKVSLDNRYFGEGITVLNNKIYQLTWKTKIGFIYNAHTYKKLGEFTYPTEGWGMTHDNTNLIMSDGSDKLYFMDSTNLKIVRTITVMDGNLAVRNLNELEWVNGSIYANIWQTGSVIKINPANGKVTGRLNLSTITNEISRLYPDADVLNGIGYDANSKAFIITGKQWPKSYLIRIQ